MYERELVRAYDHLGQGSPVWGKVELARSDELIHGFFRVGVEWHLPGDHSKDDHTKAPAIHLVVVFLVGAGLSIDPHNVGAKLCPTPTYLLAIRLGVQDLRCGIFWGSTRGPKRAREDIVSRKAKIDELNVRPGLVRFQHKVFKFQISVHNALAVQKQERVYHGSDNLMSVWGGVEWMSVRVRVRSRARVPSAKRVSVNKHEFSPLHPKTNE